MSHKAPFSETSSSLPARTSRSTAIVLTSLFSLIANLLLTLYRAPIIAHIDPDGFLLLFGRFVINVIWPQLYAYLSSDSHVHPLLSIALSGVLSTFCAYFDGLVMGILGCPV